MHPGGCLMEFSDKTHSWSFRSRARAQERKSMRVKLYSSGLLEVDLLGTAPHLTDLKRRRRASTRASVQ